MATLTGKKIKNSYKDLLQVSNSNSGIDSTLRTISDGEATDSVLQLSSSAVNISSAGALQYAGTAITATAAELNALDGITATVSELNILDGVTSTASELNILDGVTSTAAELNVLDGYTGSVTELNYLDTLHATGVTNTEFDYLDGVTSNIQTQLDATLDTAGTLIDISSTTINVDLSEASEAAIANGDYILFLDGGSTGTAAKESLADLATLFAGDGLAASSSVLAVSVDDSSIETNSDALRVKASGITNAMLAGSIANAKLSNSSITVTDGSNSTATSLGGTVTFSGTTNEVNVAESSGTITIGLPDDITIAGDLTVNGDTVTVNTATLSVEDPLIKLAKGNNAADSIDIGFYGLYDTSGSQDLYAGLFRDANDSGKFKLFKDLQAEPTTTVNTSGTGYAVGTLVANVEGTIGTATQGTIDHDSLANFVANEHIDHSSVSITAGNGLSGGGTIASTRSLALDLNELGNETSIAQADFIPMVDATDDGSQKITFSNLEDQIFGNVSGDATVAAGGALTIANDAVEQAMIADDAVGADQLASNAVVNASIASGAAIDMDKLDGDSLASSLSDFAQDDLVILSDTDDSGNLKSMTTSNFEDAIFGNVSGDITIAAGGAATIANNSVALGTDTTGNYVATITAGTGLTSDGATSGEGIAHSLSVDAAQTQITSVGTLTALQVDNVNINGSTVTNSSGDLTIVNTVDDADIILQSDDGSGGVTAYMTLDGSVGRTEFNKNIKLADDIVIQLGTSNDLKIYHDGSHSYIQNEGSATSDLVIQNDNDNRDIIFKNDDASGGVTSYLTLDGGQNDAYFSVPVAIGNTDPTQNLDMNGKLKMRNTSTPSAEANAAMFFANSGEMRVMDAGGNNTLLSPHNFSLIPGGASEDRAWSYYSENQQGQKVNVDMMRLARLVEGLTGEKLIYTEED